MLNILCNINFYYTLEIDEARTRLWRVKFVECKAEDVPKASESYQLVAYCSARLSIYVIRYKIAFHILQELRPIL